MKVQGKNHIYRYVPNYLNNRKLPASEQIVIKLQAIMVPEMDLYQRNMLNNSRTYAPDKAQELNEKCFQALITEKFHGVENLEIEGLEGIELDFDSFYSSAPSDIVKAAVSAVQSAEILSAGEQKHFISKPASL